MKRVIGISIFMLAVFTLFVACKDPVNGDPDNDSYTVTFDKNGGDTEANPKTKTVTPPAKTVGALPAEPARTSYAFTGWNTKDDGTGSEFTAATTVTKNITVYAQWQSVTPGSFTVTFDKNGGDTEANPTTKTVTSPATTVGTLPTEPTRTDYTFVKWNTQADGNGSEFTATTPVTASITVYAQWQNVPPGSFIVTFDKNGGDTEASPQTKTVTSPATTVVTLPTAPTRTGYTFASWNTQVNGGGTAFTETTPVTESITVYAQWTPGTYTVTFDKNHTDTTGFTEANPATKTVTSPATTVVTLPTAPTRAGYNFVKWNTLANGNGSEFTATTPVTVSTTVYAEWERLYTIAFDITGNETGDSVTASPTSAKAGATITINYTLAGGYVNNRLVFSGVEADIGEVDEAGSGTKTYTVVAADADEDGTITIDAAFTHTDKTLDTIAFADNTIQKTYGDATFTEAVSNAGTGTGAITYSSSHTDIATVNASTGEVTILKAGTATITATKAEDATYEGTTANYALHIAQLQLTIGAPTGTTTKTYDGNTTATGITAGSLTNKVGSDDVTATVASATYNSANVAQANKITVVYSISGTDAGNYIKPVDSEITTSVSITKALGATVVAPTLASKTHDSVTINAVAAPGNGQTVEYNYNMGATEPGSLWGTALTFSSLLSSTEYYFFARAAANNNYEAGTASSVAITTDAAQTNTGPQLIIDFETPVTTGGIRGSQGNGSTTTQASIITDPANPGEKSLNVVIASGNNSWNTGAYVLVELPTDLSNFESFSFRFYLPSTSTALSANPFMVYAGPSTMNTENQFIQNNNGANYLLGTGVNPSNATEDRGRWIDYTIPLVENLPSGSQGLTSGTTIKLVIGMNTQNGTTYLLDDLTFTAKPDTVMQSSISPTTATFVKDDESDLYADIDVVMNLYGNTLSSISGGNPAIQPSHYTVNGSTVTLTKEYLASQLTDPATLTFNFNQGNSRNIVIKIAATDADLQLLIYDFAAATSNPGWEWIMAPDDANVGTAEWSTGDGLKVALKTKNDLVVLPFRLANGKSLTDYTLYAQVAGVTGDIGFKPFNAVITTNANKKTFGARGNNNGSTTIASFNNLVNGTTPSNFISQTWNSSASSAGAAEDGYIWIGFYVHEANPTGGTPTANSPTVYRILKLELRAN
jgi:uncharacterized repeat protein (TIGR02543 family)